MNHPLPVNMNMWGSPDTSRNATTTDQVNPVHSNQQPQQVYATSASTPSPLDQTSPRLDGGNSDVLPAVASNPSTTNTYPNATHAYPNATNAYPNTTNAYPNMTNMYSNATNVYPNATHVYPNASSAYPNATDTYSSNTYQTATHTYPNTTNPSDSQRNQSENVPNAGQLPVNLLQPQWVAMMSANGLPVEMGQYRNYMGGHPNTFNDLTNFNQQIIGANANVVLNTPTNHAGNTNATSNPNAMLTYPMGYNGQANVAWPNIHVMNIPGQHLTHTTLLNGTTTGQSVPPFTMPNVGGTLMSAPSGGPDVQSLDSLAEAVYKRITSTKSGRKRKGKKKSEEQRSAVDPSNLRHAFNSYCGYNRGTRAVLPHPPGHAEYQPRYAPGSSDPYLDMHWDQAPRSEANLEVYEEIIARMRAQDMANVHVTQRQFEKASDDTLTDELATYFQTRRKVYLAQNQDEKREKLVKHASEVRRNGRKTVKAAKRRSAIEGFTDENGEEETRGVEFLILTDVQSSEYSDSGNERGAFAVLDLPWRSPQVTYLYRELDRLHEQESTTRWSSGRGSKGGLSRARRPDPKNRVCRRPTPHRRPPAACVKRVHQDSENVKPNDPQWTITNWLNGLTLDDGYDTDTEGAGDEVPPESNISQVPDTNTGNHAGTVISGTEGSASIDSTGSNDSAIGSRNATGTPAPAPATTHARSGGAYSNDGPVNASVGGGSGMGLGTNGSGSLEGSISTDNLANVSGLVSGGIGHLGTEFEATVVDQAKTGTTL
ncbi:hypothetical protein K435DRAFT_875302 [Dendrothele bispora CBS 962.96]|uniref:Uncharacterized protein n=1 Tax=Dendrothele bispora (strain CBS 962.96) TaxID=1314807 RepID=A0A4S8KUM8_DENBC|nr:hypothetical protein K435DRAFT_875302 [Dendrothele bispora CBS 962.96]